MNASVYKAGFAPDQLTYDKKMVLVFAALSRPIELVHQNGSPFLLES
jgi:putative glutathione S-transferase